MKLLTLADGFGDSAASPVWYPNFLKWPEIIKLMLVFIENVSVCVAIILYFYTSRHILYPVI